MEVEFEGGGFEKTIKGGLFVSPLISNINNLSQESMTPFVRKWFKLIFDNFVLLSSLSED